MSMIHYRGPKRPITFVQPTFPILSRLVIHCTQEKRDEFWDMYDQLAGCDGYSLVAAHWALQQVFGERVQRYTEVTFVIDE